MLTVHEQDSKGSSKAYPQSVDGPIGWSATTPYTANAGFNETSWEEVSNWWPHRPLLQASIADTTESIFIISASNESKPNPEHDYAAIQILYWRNGASPSTASFQSILDNGGVALATFFFPSHMAARIGGPTGETEIEVRDSKAYLSEHKRPEANVDRRRIDWGGFRSGGSLLTWQFSLSPYIYTVDETIALVEGLQEETN